MKLLCWLALFSCVLLGSACQPPKTPAPTQPKVSDVRLVGGRVCGPFQVPGKEWAFTCDPLPTLSASGWQLTPAWGTDAQGRPRSNKIAVITLTAQTLTNLQVDYEPSATAIWTLRQKAPGPGQPQSVTGRGEVEVDKTDDGTTRTWTVTANASLCAREVPLRFYSLGADGTRSGGTSVVLLRPDEGQCEYSGGGGGGGSWGMSRTGPADPSPRPPSPPAQGPCSGGAARTLFGICENCTNPPDPRFNDWTGVEACNWDEVLMTFDYKNPDGTPRFPKSNTCRPPRQTDRVTCEGP